MVDSKIVKCENCHQAIAMTIVEHQMLCRRCYQKRQNKK